MHEPESIAHLYNVRVLSKALTGTHHRRAVDTLVLLDVYLCLYTVTYLGVDVVGFVRST